jgi:hypothetical protein
MVGKSTEIAHGHGEQARGAAHQGRDLQSLAEGEEAT